MKQLISIKVSEEQLKKIKKYYSKYEVANDGEYVYFMADVDGLIIIGYNGKSAKKTVTFNGELALAEAKFWDITAEEKAPKKTVKSEWLCLADQIGSDEVGVGDFLLPMIVVASFVRAKDIKILKQYGVDDSKKIKDEDIMKIGEGLAKKFFISKLTISNEKYNEMYAKGENLNSLKAKMHNRALLNLYKKFPETKNIFVDQFVEPKTYFKYLNDENEPQVTNITFKTKGESYYPCVALSSVMARYAFLLEKQKLEEKYGMKFPCGASSAADDFAKKFVKKFGIEELKKIAKINFANFKELIK